MGIGGTPFTAVAIERAVEMAVSHDARLMAVTIMDPDRLCKVGPVPAGAGYYARQMCQNRMAVTKDQIDEAIASLEAACKKSGIRLDIARESGDSFEMMIDHARHHDLTIFGLRSIFDYQLVQEPEKDLIRLLLSGVRPILAVSDHLRPIQKVMVAYSGSMESAKAMRRFVQFRLWPEALLDIVHFNEGSVSGNALLKEAEKYCRDHGYTVQTRMIPGKPDDLLLRTADEINADLIVMGNSIRSIWLRKVLGDTVLSALRKADRPIFLSQ